MKRLRIRLLVILGFFLFGLSARVWAQGVIVPWPLPPPAAIRSQMPVLQKSSLRFTIKEQAGSVVLEQIWKNPANRSIEGQLLIPLPEGSQVTGFKMAVGDTVYSGKILQREKARRIYEDIVRRLRDPALLELAGRNLFRSQVFPLRPHEKRRIRVEFAVVFPSERNQVRIEFPLTTPRFLGAAAGGLSPAQFILDGVVTSRVPIKNAYSPTAGVDISQPENGRLKISFEGPFDRLKARSLRLFYSLNRNPVGISALTFRKDGAPGFFLLFVSPEFKKRVQTLPTDFVFILDRSGSMSGEKIEQAKTALKYCLNRLKPADRFVLVTFSSEVRILSPEWLPARAGRAKALAFVDSVEAAGGTNLHDALGQIGTFNTSSNRPMEVVFLTDGKPTVGVTDEKTILRDFSHRVKKNWRLFVFGVGFDVNTFLLNRLSEAGHGTVVYVEPGANLEQRMTDFFEKIRSPVLTDLTLDWNGLGVEEVFPKKLPDLFRGSQLVLAGRFRNPGLHILTLSGKTPKGLQKFQQKIEFPRENTENDFVPVVWASRKIGYLLEKIRWNGENGELKNEIIHLSNKYGIITPYTSYLIRPPEKPVPSPPHRLPGPPRFGPEKAQMALMRDFVSKGSNRSGEAAFYISSGIQTLQNVEQVAEEKALRVQFVAGRTFVWRDSLWVEKNAADKQPEVRIAFGSPAYFDLLTWHPGLKNILGLGERVVFLLGTHVVEIAQTGKSNWSENEARKNRRLAP